jgi:hypothetical protein
MATMPSSTCSAGPRKRPPRIVEKRPELARRQGAFSVSNGTGQILKRGQELAQVLRVLDKKRFNVVD